MAIDIKQREAEYKEQTKKLQQDAFIRQRHLARTMAMQFLFQADLSSDWDRSELVLNNFFDTASFNDEPDEEQPLQSDVEGAMPFAEKLINGVAVNLEEIDAAITAAARNWDINRMAFADRAILRMATYEIIHMQAISAATTINEAVELAKQFGEADSPRFINGVLDKIRTTYNKKSKGREASK